MRAMSRDRVVVAMSGGVDSSVTALLLRNAGFRVSGLFLRLADPPGGAGGDDPAGEARRAARLLRLPFAELDLRAEFGRIVDGFVSEYRRGRTPNPCVRCNREMKFHWLLAFAAEGGIEQVATGHYARLTRMDERRAIRRGVDRRKDQSYVLFALSQTQLGRILLPLGDRHKEEVRALAREAGLPAAEKAESQDACFLPGGGYRVLLRGRGGLTPGPLVDETGEVVGRHEGVELFTVGQRRGVGAHRVPRYVYAIEPGTGTVRIGPRESVLRREFTVEDWVGSGRDVPGDGEEFEAKVQVRYRHRAAPAVLRGGQGGRVRVTFTTPQEAITPGQAAVAYDGETVLGGGWIAGAGGP